MEKTEADQDISISPSNNNLAHIDLDTNNFIILPIITYFGPWGLEIWINVIIFGVKVYRR